MGKFLNLFSNQKKIYTELASNNCNAIRKYNEKILAILSLTVASLLLLPLFAAPFSNSTIQIVPVYLLAISLYVILFFLFKLPVMKKYVIFGLYICFSIFFLLAIYLSVIHTPEMRATILLGAFCIMPLSFIDRPNRMNLFVIFWFMVHTILAFHFKPRYALDDTLNCLCFAIFSCFLGNITILIRLQSYDAQRRLINEKETDILTGLFNRRKLFETLISFETTDAKKPSGILMLDIDHFKEFNDKYGHATGDCCLRRFGEILKYFTQTFRLQFYRYGGEEFVAMAYEYDENELLAIAESLRIAIKDTDMDGHSITVSIGAAYCGDEQVLNYEKVINRADNATYLAKRTGRNKVCIEQNEARVEKTFE